MSDTDSKRFLVGNGTKAKVPGIHTGTVLLYLLVLRIALRLLLHHQPLLTGSHIWHTPFDCSRGKPMENQENSTNQEPAAKKAKVSSSRQETTRTLLNILDDDALRAVLIRTCASDHDALRQTCKRLRNIVDSIAFRKERSELGFAEVRCEIVPPFEQYKMGLGDSDDEKSLHSDDTSFLEQYDELGYKGEYGDHTLEHLRVIVNGKEIKMKSFSVNFLPRKVWGRHGGFFEMCDSLSDPLQELSVTFFNNRGKPRLASLKELLGGGRQTSGLHFRFRAPLRVPLRRFDRWPPDHPIVAL